MVDLLARELEVVKHEQALEIEEPANQTRNSFKVDTKAFHYVLVPKMNHGETRVKWLHHTSVPEFFIYFRTEASCICDA